MKEKTIENIKYQDFIPSIDNVRTIQNYILDPSFDSTYTTHIYEGYRSKYLKELPFPGYVLNELIGSKIAQYFHLQTIEYELVKYEDNKDTHIALLSQDLDPFDKELKLEVPGTEILKDRYGNITRENSCYEKIVSYIERIHKHTLHGVFPNIQEELFNLSAFTYLTHEVDRSSNLFYTCYEKQFHLYPLFDFEDCFTNDTTLYDALCIPPIEMRHLKNKYPTFQTQIDKINELDMDMIFYQLEREFPIKIDTQVKDIYKEYIDNRRNQLEQALEIKQSTFQKHYVG